MKIKFILSIGLCFLLSACGFSSPSPHDVPPQLRILYLDSSNPYDPVSVQLQRRFQSVGIQFVSNEKLSPVTLRMISSKWTYNIPTILFSGNAVTYTYTLTVVYQLQTKHGITPPKTLSVQRSLIQNANQIYTPEATELMKREITRTMVIVLYYDLISLPSRNALIAILGKK